MGLSANFIASALVPPPIQVAYPAELRFGTRQMISPVSITITTPSAVQSAVGEIESKLVKQGSSRKLTGVGSPTGSAKNADSSNAPPRHVVG
jgi:uroporphyrinogen-III synthase